MNYVIQRALLHLHITVSNQLIRLRRVAEIND